MVKPMDIKKSRMIRIIYFVLSGLMTIFSFIFGYYSDSVLGGFKLSIIIFFVLFILIGAIVYGETKTKEEFDNDDCDFMCDC
jgi:predicted membrane channel-forming protein YqfA (hemolysin III family)